MNEINFTKMMDAQHDVLKYAAPAIEVLNQADTDSLVTLVFERDKLLNHLPAITKDVARLLNEVEAFPTAHPFTPKVVERVVLHIERFSRDILDGVFDENAFIHYEKDGVVQLHLALEGNDRHIDANIAVVVRCGADGDMLCAAENIHMPLTAHGPVNHVH